MTLSSLEKGNVILSQQCKCWILCMIFFFFLIILHVVGPGQTWRRGWCGWTPQKPRWKTKRGSWKRKTPQSWRYVKKHDCYQTIRCQNLRINFFLRQQVRVKAQRPGDIRLQEVLYSTEAHTDRYFCSKERDSLPLKHNGMPSPTD